MKNVLLYSFLSLIFIACSDEAEFVTENIKSAVNNETFESIKIGNQIWMAENLNVSHYRNGDPINMLEPDDYWRQTTEGAWCYYNNDSVNYAKYGRLYNWYAVNDARGLCPEGWRIPSTDEYDNLINYLGTDTTSGDFLKDTSSIWITSQGTQTNSSKFSALPLGYRLTNGDFLNFGKIACFWTSTPGDNNNAWDIFLIGKSPMVGKSQTGFEHGYSCRCIKE